MNAKEKIVKMANEMEAVERFLAPKGRFVDDMVHIGISDLAALLQDCIVIPKGDIPEGLEEAVRCAEGAEEEERWMIESLEVKALEIGGGALLKYEKRLDEFEKHCAVLQAAQTILKHSEGK